MVTHAIESGRAHAPAPAMPPLVVGRLDQVRFRVRAEVLYEMHWPHEGSGGILAGDFGTPHETGVEAEVDVTLHGRFTCELQEDGRGRPRLTLHRESDDFRVEAAIVELPGDRRIAGVEPPLDRALAARLAASFPTDRQLFAGSFDFTSDGLRRYHLARSGDFRWAGGAMPIRTAIEIHLPFLGRRDWPRRDDLLRALDWEISHAGRVRAALAGEEPVAGEVGFLLATAIWLHRTGGPALATLAHEHHWDGSPAAKAARDPLLAACGFDARAIAGPAALSLNLRADDAAAWTRTGAPDGVDFFRQFASVSLAIQRAMRLWLPAVYLAAADRLADTESAVPVMLYQHARTFTGKYRGEYAPDPMAPEALDSAFRSARPLVKLSLDRAERALAGHPAAAAYAPAKRRNLLDAVQRDPRKLRALLAAEMSIIDLMISFGVECHGWGERLADPRFEPKLVRRAAARFAKALRYRLRRVYGNLDYRGLATMLLVEATAALSASQGGPGEVAALVSANGGVYRR